MEWYMTLFEIWGALPPPDPGTMFLYPVPLPGRAPTPAAAGPTGSFPGGSAPPSLAPH